MASVDITTSPNTGSRFFGLLSRMGAGAVHFFDLTMSARDRSAQVERLQAKSDAELAAMGLTRDDIVRHVFRDIIYL